ncbi:10057_t:CDS:1 [Ambispora gerdemannii]|uniref:Multifunctional tryptophan biosynthesis protein n=1 Tax=Ambispora gerdemannii TaxID=144530 RepID=A0A9N9A1E3_9GLOM|nr:10057_t:CDS:1 [Ambispora gerdemannii]
MTTILIDNYDSFTWNIYQYLCELGAEVLVFRNDQTTIQEIQTFQPVNLVISPGPGQPSTDSGISQASIKYFAGKIPILGVCLGEQCIFEVFGGEVSYAGEIVHGKTSKVKHDSKGIFINVPQDIAVTRYHSLASQAATLPEELVVTCWTDNNVVMGVRHHEYTIEGVQFHPESIISEHGKTILKNFLELKGGKWEENPTYNVETPLTKVTVKEQAIPSILEKIHKQRLQDIETAKKTPGSTPFDLQKLLSLHVAPPLVDFVSRIKQTLPEYPAIMAEVKRASPSKGNIDLSANAAEQALAYARAGASVISVLTEEKWFKGSLNDLRQVRDIVSTIPNRPAVLRKDFIVDTYQIMEARIYGADTVLLIVAILSDQKLLELYKFAKNLGMEPLVEVNNEEEMKRATNLGAKVIGVNNRNLHTFSVDMQTTSRLAEMVPKGVILVALSGITGRQDVIEYLDQGVGALLIGEALMRAEDKRAFIHEILGLEQVNKTLSDMPNRPLIKICGVSTVNAAIEAVDAGADLIGLIFAKSRRQVPLDRALEIIAVVRELQSEKQIKIDDIKRFTENNNNNSPHTLSGHHNWFRLHATRLSRARKPLLVGVFQNQPLEEITAIVDYLKLDLVQLHGDEPLDLTKFLPVPVIKAFHVDETFSDPILVTQPGYNAFCLLDTKVSGSSGGSGVSFDWNIALKVKQSAGENFPLILAGGLTPDNVKDAIEKVKPFAVDVSSGVETDNEKDPVKIKDFIRAAKSIVYGADRDGSMFYIGPDR